MVEALAVYQERQSDLVLLDIMLPEKMVGVRTKLSYLTKE